MYRFDLIDRLMARRGEPAEPGRFAHISPVVWSLGLTSFLTDISSEMVNSILPVYLVLHLRLSPMQYGAIDGIYNGFAIVLMSLFAGWLADRTHRQKEVAAAGYGLSAVCKLLLLAAGGAWGWIMLVTGLDRLGKGLRSAPRDALISLNTQRAYLASAFGVHRAMDAAGALIGPLLAFFLLAQLPGAFDVLWIISFVFAGLGLAALWLFVPRSRPEADSVGAPEVPVTRSTVAPVFATPRFMSLCTCATLLAAVTISDGFIYLLLQAKGGTNAGFVPLFYVMTAGAYMLFSIPVGRVADRIGRVPVLVAGYLMLAAVYAILLYAPASNMSALIGCLALFGLYYAGTEGVLVALASSILPPERRTVGIAFLATGIGLGKMISSVLFGWLWQSSGETNSILIFTVGLVLSGAITVGWLRRSHFE